MTYSLSFITDSLGRRRAVKLSLRDWRKIEKKLNETESEAKLRSDLVESFEDIRLYKQGKKKLKTLEELLAGK